jgi:Family of unknown function (DUF5901)
MSCIDDVDFMQKHSEKDSATFLIDSSVRDRYHYPSPSEYVISFSEPVRNVFGVEILDASIPGTMYNVDYHNSMLRYGVMLSGSFNVGSDYTDAFGICTGSTRFKACVADSALAFDTFVLSDQAWASHGPAANPRIEILDRRSANLAIVYSITQATLELVPERVLRQASPPLAPTDATRRLDSGGLWFQADGVWYMTRDTQLAERLEAFIDAGPEHDACVLAQPDSAQSYDIVLISSFFVAYDGQAPLTSDLTWVDDWQQQQQQPATDFRGLGIHEWQLAFRNLQLELGNYNISSLAATLNEGLVNAGIRVISATNSTFEKQNKLCFINATWPFVIDTVSSTAREVLGFDFMPGRDSGLSPTSDQTASPPYVRLPLGADPYSPGAPVMTFIFGSVYSGSNGGEWVVRAPGVTNLLGIRYVTLRCPEIEDHLHGSRSFGSHSTGVGVFKLASPNEVANLRFDFVNLIRKPFHPIGKLARLTIRFEFGKNGKLYDFKGINHQLLINMKYYSPPRTPRPPRSLLNPDYDPDYVAYAARMADYAGRSDDDDDHDYQHDENNNSNNIESNSKSNSNPNANSKPKLNSNRNRQQASDAKTWQQRRLQNALLEEVRYMTR